MTAITRMKLIMSNVFTLSFLLKERNVLFVAAFLLLRPSLVSLLWYIDLKLVNLRLACVIETSGYGCEKTDRIC